VRLDQRDLSLCTILLRYNVIEWNETCTTQRYSTMITRSSHLRYIDLVITLVWLLLYLRYAVVIDKTCKLIGLLESGSESLLVR
jgi:hypothetical protein